MRFPKKIIYQHLSSSITSNPGATQYHKGKEWYNTFMMSGYTNLVTDTGILNPQFSEEGISIMLIDITSRKSGCVHP